MRQKNTFIVCAAGILFMAFSGSAAAKNNSSATVEMPAAVKQALVRELGTNPKIVNVKSQLAHSAKRSYDEGSIGRKLTADQWRESQAWQALAGYNAAKQARHHGMDSMGWCTFRGGGNSGTYMKPLVDFDDHAKLAFYTYKSTLQKYFASSKGVDVVYGPNDKITPVIIGLGEKRTVDLTVRCINERGKVVSTKKFADVTIPAGRPIVELAAFRPNITSEGCYAVTYAVTERGNVLGRTFELKCFSNDTAADGDTDFIGDTSVFDTDQRIEFLKQYADMASRFFKDPNLDKKVVTDADVTAALKKLKPQPLPEVRKRLVLNSGWKHLARRDGETAADKKRLATWSNRGVSIKGERLVITRDNTKIVRTFAPQDWRFFLQWTVVPAAGKTAEFTIGDGKTSLVTIDIDRRGNVTAGGVKADRIKPGTAGQLKLEVDLQYNQFSLYIDGKR
ncbi:MAG: hypothetical protein J7M12_02695, partial [Candidatus Hydrogenedentes bacterium]|nr:hypothetical protein [Candidatus Hydrogenedentota bacterium]